MYRLVALISLAVASPALASDLVIESGQVAPDMAPIDWTGFYAGVSGGFVAGTGRAERGAFAGPLITLDVSNGLFPGSISNLKGGFAGGIATGYNFQTGNFVAGIEADVTVADYRISHAYSRVDPNPVPPFTGVDTNTTYQTEVEFVGTLRLRGGYSLGDTLVYATGGLAVARATNRFTLEIPQLFYTSPGWSIEDTHFGYTIGTGIEHRLTEQISISIEGRYVDLEDATVNASDPVTFPGETIAYRFENDFFIGKVGLNYHF